MSRLITLLFPYLSLTALWGVMVLLVGTGGEFPLNDDWTYARAVKHLVEVGGIQIDNWGEMTLIAHLGWGGLFCSIFGFSFETLRWSILVLGLLGGFGAYQLARDARFSVPGSWLCAVMLLFNPIYAGLSFSFMTDVPFTAVMIWASVFFLRCMRDERWLWLILAVVLSIWGVLIRQLALVWPAAFGMVMIFRQQRKHKWLRTELPALLVVAVYFGYQELARSAGWLSETYNSKLEQLVDLLSHPDGRLLRNIPGYVLVSVGYLGLFGFPVIWWLRHTETNWRKYLGLAFGLLAGTGLFLGGKTFPTLDNVWVNFGIGPITTPDFYGRVTEMPGPLSPTVFLLLLTVLGLWAGWFLLKEAWQLVKGWKRSFDESQATRWFALLVLLGNLGPLVVTGLYDRYLIALLPLALILLPASSTMNLAPQRIRVVVATAVVLVVCSTLMTHDYLSWNRVRWQALEELRIDPAIGPDRMVGGVEFDAYYHFSNDNPEWYTTYRDDYMVTLTPQAGFQVVKTYPWSRWMPGEGTIYILEKTD